MVFELYGCTGCGKTTVTAKTVNMLRAKGYECVDYQELFFNNEKNRRAQVASYLLAALNPRYSPLTFRIFMTARSLSCPLRYAFYLATLCQRILKYEKSADNSIILLEEGIIQFVTSLSHGKAISECEMIGTLLKDIKEYGIKPKSVNCVLPMEDNIRRITGRGLHSRFLDVNSVEKLKNLLTIKRENLDFVSAEFGPVLTLDMTRPPEENAAILYDKILSFVQ